MNYDHINQIHDFLEKEYRPLLRSVYAAPSFQEYLRKLSYTKTLKWLRDIDQVKFSRPQMALDPIAFAKKFQNKCVSAFPPGKPEEGVYKAIYQLSPSFHMESVLWAWVENNVLNNYVTFIACYQDDDDYSKVITELEPLRRTGNTEQRSNTGFAIPKDGRDMRELMGLKKGIDNSQ